MDLNLESLSRTQQTMIAGGIAGITAKTATAPLSRLTILYQVHHVQASATFKSYSTHQPLYAVINDVYKQEGIMSFWKGNLTAVVHRFPYSAVNFAVYDFMKKSFRAG